MGDTWRRTRGAAVSEDGEQIRLGITTGDGQDIDVALAPDLVVELVVELLAARSRAMMLAKGPRSTTDERRMHEPIIAQELVQTDYVDRGRSLVQLKLPGGGLIEALVPIGKRGRTEVKG
ncbi:MAG: hypothetical protein GYB50_27205 [Rhodobacteraceae bacterium]|uniref:hypothetical protein n=1 Tax=Salipiger thiooxidans TaxID=282683 RepID=UPI001A8F8FD4|nr:hypothetical protein [Salipiger thiooxidans]MBN8190447.1 hypothetical protein [Salipiger thiooxidans]MBR9841501.1 hypothetical protein [Paracoccaceae bacterium]